MPKQDRQTLDINSGLKSPSVLICRWITTVTSCPLKVAERHPLPSEEDADPAEAAGTLACCGGGGFITPTS